MSWKQTPLGLLNALDPVWATGVRKSWVVSYQEVVHAQAICEGVPALGL